MHTNKLQDNSPVLMDFHNIMEQKRNSLVRYVRDAVDVAFFVYFAAANIPLSNEMHDTRESQTIIKYYRTIRKRKKESSGSLFDFVDDSIFSSSPLHFGFFPHFGGTAKMVCVCVFVVFRKFACPIIGSIIHNNS